MAPADASLCEKGEANPEPPWSRAATGGVSVEHGCKAGGQAPAICDDSPPDCALVT